MQNISLPLPLRERVGVRGFYFFNYFLFICMYISFSFIATKRERNVPKERENTQMKWITTMPFRHKIKWLLRASPHSHEFYSCCATRTRHIVVHLPPQACHFSDNSERKRFGVAEKAGLLHFVRNDTFNARTYVRA